VVREQAQAVEVALASGSARFDVAHVPGRRFSVSLGMATVNVVGTRFEVARAQRAEGTLVRVEVTRGIVEVRRRDQPDTVRRLTAGETWSALLPSAPPQAAKPVEGVVDAKAVDALPSEDALVEEFSLDELDEAPPAVTASKARAAARARELFQQANVARRAGQMQEAADAYAELLRKHRRDARAGLSAFELGRIRMDALGDPKGAVSAFNRALGLAPTAGFREDALARIVIAYDAMGQRAACLKAREGYLGKYPQGVHAGSLAARCK
jgi:tetratricopeptide (TPR) repeat protein